MGGVSLCPPFFIFIKFSVTIGQIISWRPPPLRLVPPPHIGKSWIRHWICLHHFILFFLNKYHSHSYCLLWTKLCPISNPFHRSQVTATCLSVQINTTWTTSVRDMQRSNPGGSRLMLNVRRFTVGCLVRIFTFLTMLHSHERTNKEIVPLHVTLSIKISVGRKYYTIEKQKKCDH